MPAAIKLSRIGKKDFPVYRIVVIDKRKKRNANYIEKIGFYNPHKDPSEIIINKEKLTSWLKKGAVISEGVNKVLKRIRFSRI